MSSIVIQDLGRSRELDPHAMSAVRGGFGPSVNVNVNLDQKIGQFQAISVNVLNNNRVIGAGLDSPAMNASPMEWSANPAAVPQF